MSGVDKRVPITIVSGFKSNGKSEARLISPQVANILKSGSDLKTVVLTQDVQKIKDLADANAVQLAEDDCIQLKDGCVCCSLRSELMGQVYDLAKSEKYGYIIVEASDAADPEELAETFSAEMEDDEEDDEEADEEGLEIDEHDRIASEKVKQIMKEGGLNKFVKVDSAVTIVNAETVLSDFHSTEFVGDGSKKDDEEDEEEESTLTDALIAQIEFADAIYLNNASKASAEVKQQAHGVIKALNKRAKVIEIDNSAVEAKDVINAGLFTPVESFNPEWLRAVKNSAGGDSYANNNGIESFVYRRRVPFHPARLAKLFKESFHFIQQSEAQDDEWEDQEEDAEEDEGKGKGKAVAEAEEEEAPLDEITTENLVDASSRKQKGVFASLLRAKGSFWIASRVAVGGALQSSGPVLSAASGEMWYSKIPEEDLAQVTPDEQKYVREVVFDGKFGDRRQEIFIVGGPNFNRKEIEQTLDAALLTDDEFKTYTSIFDKELGVLEKDEELAKVFEGDSEFVQWADDLIMALLDEEEEDDN
ncbi:hypothetical protein E3Q19_02421 [Wallemia mellicola]|nr:hypothetical protein E3Q19_02421 [Wallemia mellicola]TIC27212.1 hypothetical protein E3Q11_02624 [Wallemia mellicola]TIC74196.1 hypothetical protein E3Q00_02171 [Wallemia mellicola]